MDHLNKGSWYDALSCFNTPDQDPEGVWMMSKAGGETGCLLLSGHDASKHPWRSQVSSAAEAEKPSGEQRDDSSSGFKSLSPGWETEYGMGQGLEWTHLSISVLSWKNKGHDVVNKVMKGSKPTMSNVTESRGMFVHHNELNLFLNDSLRSSFWWSL